MKDETKTQDQATAQAVDLYTLVMLAKSLIEQELTGQMGNIWGIKFVKYPGVPANLLISVVDDSTKPIHILNIKNGKIWTIPPLFPLPYRPFSQEKL